MRSQDRSVLPFWGCFALALCATLAALTLTFVFDPHPDTAAQFESTRQQELLAFGCWAVALLLWGTFIGWSVYRTTPERYLLPRRAQLIIGLVPVLLLGLILADLFQSRWHELTGNRPRTGTGVQKRPAHTPAETKPAP